MDKGYQISTILRGFEKEIKKGHIPPKELRKIVRRQLYQTFKYCAIEDFDWGDENYGQGFRYALYLVRENIKTVFNWKANENSK